MKQNVFVFFLMLLSFMSARGQNYYDYPQYGIVAEGLVWTIYSTSHRAIVQSPRGIYTQEKIYANLKHLDIPEKFVYNGVEYHTTEIGDRAFQNCTKLESVNIPDGVIRIGLEAFDGCSNLKSIQLPTSVVEFGNRAFCRCQGLSSLVIPSGITKIGEGAFSGWSNLMSIEVEDGNVVYDSRDNCNGIIETATNKLIVTCKNTVVPNSVTAIGAYAFAGSTWLEHVNISKNISSIGLWAFYDCPNVISVTVEKDNPKYDSRDNCNGIIETSANTLAFGFGSTQIPTTVTTIGTAAFSAATGLKSVTIPFGIERISSAFDECKLFVVMAKNPKTQINDNSFPVATFMHAILYIPVGTRSDFVYGGEWYRFYNIKESVTETDDLSYTRVYTLMDAQTLEFAVYDSVNDVIDRASDYWSIDESAPSSSWQVVNNNGQKFLYNIGAKQYAFINHEGKMVLSDAAIPVTIEDSKDGIVIGGNVHTKWHFVVNDRLKIDKQVTGIEPVADACHHTGNTIYSLNGQKKRQLQRGVNIVRNSDGKTKKVVFK